MGLTTAAYDGLLAAGEIEADPAQASVLHRFDELAQRLADWRPLGRRGLWSALRRSGTAPAQPRGLYVHGGVGHGKTMLMDLFYETVAFPLKRRLHFHEFMAEVHERIGKSRATRDGDPIPFVARELAADSALLCLDEMQVTDIADAMILDRLFKVLLSHEVVMVTTSNTAPQNLYRDGLNRQLFLPFIDLIEAQVDVIPLRSAKDFRLDKLAGRQLFFVPADSTARQQIDAHWDRLTGGHPAQVVDLAVKGRQVHVPRAAMGVARFRFADLCEQPLGALDYLHIAHAFHTVLIDDIPVLGPERRNEARRFITLIDSFYDQRVCLIASAAAAPHELYPTGDGAQAFERTASRLMEMRSEAYVNRADLDSA